MSVSPFSVQHDYEVQEYKKLRRAYLASERRRQAEEKTMKKAFQKDRRMSLQSTMRMSKAERSYLQRRILLILQQTILPG
jgi:hypothetical protein